MSDSEVDGGGAGQSDEMDAEPDSDQEQDLDQVLGAWLGELENMTKQLDSDRIDVSLPTSPLPQPSYDILDNFRFSQFNLQNQVSNGGSTNGDSQDVDLDALLGDLCEMELNLQEQMASGVLSQEAKTAQNTSDRSSPSQDSGPPPPPPPPPLLQGEMSDDVDMGDLPPPPPMDETQSTECDSSAPLPPPPPPSGPEIGMAGGIQLTPPPPAPPPPPLHQSNGEAGKDNKQTLVPAPPPPPKPESLTISVSPSNSTMTVSEGTQEGTGSPDSTMTAGTHSPMQSPQQAPGVNQGPRMNHGQQVVVEVTPSSPAPHSFGPISPRSPPFQSPPANLSKSVRVKLKEIEDQLESDPSLTEEERQAKIKSEKIKIALEKLKKANIQKLIVRVYTDDGSSKTVFLDETLTCRMVTSMMIEKNHLEFKPELAITEQIPDLYMERVVEDHENLVSDVLMNWKRETTCRVLFCERKEKYAIFKNPQNYLLSASSSQAAQQFAEKSKEVLIKEFFSDTGSQVPEVEGPLWMKAEGKKSWKRFYFILRASGLYFSPKGKSKSSTDLVCLVRFEHNHVYHGVSWKKKYKAPTDHCFAIKHPQLQQKSKYIKYLCADDYRSCQRWMAGIRLAKFGMQLLDNYNWTQKEITEYKVRRIAEGTPQSNGMSDSASLSSMQSTVSSHSSSSGSLHDSKTSRASLSVFQPTQTLPLQANAPTRKGTVGNMFANAWKKGSEGDTGTNLNPEFRRPAIVTPTKSKRPTDTMTEFEVQRALQELETHLDLSNEDQDDY